MSEAIIDLLEAEGIHFVTDHKNVRDGWIGLDCPWCGTHGKYHLGINLEGKFANCWQCGSHSAVSVLMELLRISYKQAHQAVGLPSYQVTKKKRGKLQVPNQIGPLLNPHLEYLRSRRFDPDEIQRRWEVMGIGIAARLAWSLFIPIISGGETQSWTCRSIGESWRYHTAKASEEQTAAKELLYGEDYARNAIVVVEGPTDVWRIGPGAVATMGLSFTQAQVQRILQYPIRAICFDNSLQAQSTANRLAGMLELFPGKTMRIELDSDDPGNASDREVRAVRHCVFGE